MLKFEGMKRLILAMALPALLSACFARGGYVYSVSTEVPPPQYEDVVVRPGYVWVGGHWGWNNRWVWAPGFYERERPGYVYVGGNWAHHGNGNHYVPGYWRPGASGTVVVPSQRPRQQGPWRPGPGRKPEAPRPDRVHDYRK
jgi:hypothetical protein